MKGYWIAAAISGNRDVLWLAYIYDAKLAYAVGAMTAKMFAPRNDNSMIQLCDSTGKWNGTGWLLGTGKQISVSFD